jgi:hypothetical protein
LQIVEGKQKRSGRFMAVAITPAVPSSALKPGQEINFTEEAK